MGQGNADAALVSGLLGTDSGLRVTDFTFTGLRGSIPGARRMPLGKLSSAPRLIQSTVGRGLYRAFDLVHRLDLRLPPAPGVEVLTVYDLAPLHFDDEGAWPLTGLDAVRAAAAVVCPSRFAAEEVSNWSGRSDVDVITLGVDPLFFDARPPTAQQRAAAGLPERWVLHAGGVTRRKNLARLRAAWPAVRADFPDTGLILCGPDDPRRTELFADVDGVFIMGRIPRRALAALVSGAAAVVVPSIYEGFGLPVQEAMAAGVPVVAVAAASLPEVAGPGAILVPDETDALANGMAQALSGIPAERLAAARETVRARSWASTARAHVALYERVLGRDATARTNEVDQ